MEKPWRQLGSAEAQLAHLEKRLDLLDDVDALIEECMREHSDLKKALDVVFRCLLERLQAQAVFVRTYNEDLSMTLYSAGVTPELLAKTGKDMLVVSAPSRFEQPGLSWFVIPLDLAAETIGSFGIAFLKETRPVEWVAFDLLTAAAEQLDNFFYGIQERRRKHMAIQEIQRCLKHRLLIDAVNEAVTVLETAVAVRDLWLFFVDDDVNGRKQIQYLIYQEFEKRYDSVERPMPELTKLIAEKGMAVLAPDSPELARIIPLDGSTETLLLDGLIDSVTVGKMVVRPAEGVSLSLSGREIIQVFADALRQRLVDFNRERRMLRQSFSPATTRRLLRESDYEQRYLCHRAHDLAILYADISGFTKLCEQVLKDPARIGRFVDGWSSGVVERVFAEQGTFDKLVGDCAIGLFGPPFYSVTSAEMAAQAVRAAIAIRDFTRRFLVSDENADIWPSPLMPHLGVAIGLNFCSGNVGFFGPNEDYTCFSSGMNNTARLQGVAHANEIFAMAPLKQLVDSVGVPSWTWEGPFSAPVKNVQNPLSYYRLCDVPAAT